MMRLKAFKAAAVAVALSVTAVVSVAMAQGGGQHEGGHGGRGMKWHGRGDFGGTPWLADLNLTDAQKAQMKQIHDSHSATIQSLSGEMRAKRQEVRQLSMGESFDESLVRQKLTEIAGIEAKLMGEQFRIHQETLGVLTPEQKTQLEQKKEQFKNKWKERREQKAPGAAQ